MNPSNHKPNRRVLTIDDNHATHEDFRKILGPGLVADSMSQADAALFDESAADATANCFEIDSAMQGQEGLGRVQQATFIMGVPLNPTSAVKAPKAA